MKRRILMAVLAIGTIAGYAAGFHGMRHCREHRDGRRAAFERHIASVCVEAARHADQKGAAAPQE